MVQTQEQYMLCYRAVAALFEQQLKLIDAHTYENLDEDGEPLILSRISAEDGSNRRSLDNESSSENSSDNESRESDKNINVVSPTKDVEQLIGAWQIKNICNSGNSKENEPSSEEPSICDTKQEKLVGKATVIRRPSIAKLKALFENKQAFEPVNSGSSCRNPKVTLQRSFSTRERGSTFMSTEDISIKMNNSFSEPQSFSPQPDRHDIPDSAFIIDDNSASHNFQSTEKNDFSNYWGSQHSSMSLPSEEIGSNNEAASSQSHNKQSYPIRPVFTKWPFSQSRDAESIQVDKAPPKPPRTFQYNNENNNLTDHSSETEYSRSSGGRIIVSVALPKNQERREESHYEYLRAQPRTYNNATHKHFHHEENLYDFPSYHAMRNSSETNIYEPKIQKVSAVCRELSKSSQGLVSKEPIYYEPMSNSNNLAFGSSQQNHFPINLRRDLSVPALPISQSVPPNSHVPNLNVENGNISAPVRQVPQKYVKCDQNRQPPGFIQPSFNKPNTYRYPITYVRPQPNANCKAAPAKARPNKPLSDKVKNESAANDKKTKTETVNREDITKSANHRERENHGKKQGSFASFFGFGKKKKEKSKQIVNTTQQQSTTVSNQGTD
ncbi:tyrosine phosphatase-like protein [Dinothrombium tinctorium]|uniref:Tyrosine phosphatase-like protein n=1 Tax=Dinothrombium tinctorium TaxID=1965070 RepID=A0A3S3P9U1_9ACAR|nr:tyrosine phosphatase-like protein [Dinothrombium tinctorium]